MVQTRSRPLVLPHVLWRVELLRLGAAAGRLLRVELVGQVPLGALLQGELSLQNRRSLHGQVG